MTRTLTPSLARQYIRLLMSHRFGTIQLPSLLMLTDSVIEMFEGGEYEAQVQEWSYEAHHGQDLDSFSDKSLSMLRLLSDLEKHSRSETN